MNNSKGFVAIVFIASGLFCSCGGRKQVATSNSGIIKEVYQESDACVKLAEAKPEVRAWGEAYNHRISFAKSYAEGQARAEMRRKLSVAIKSATSEDEASYEKYASSGNEGQAVRDEGNKGNLFVDQIAEGIVSNAVVIKSSQYLRNDGSYHIYVCLEFRDGVSKMAEDITKKVDQQVSDEERMKMNFEFNKFRERIENELKNQK